MKSAVGVMGLGTMGKALAKNLLNHDYSVSGYNRSEEPRKALEIESGFNGFSDIEKFVLSLDRPRKIFMFLPSGEIVDNMIENLLKYLEEGDILLDCGNSYFKDTIRREKNLRDKGILFYGVGVSGGEKGALLGPSIMPGGDKKEYFHIKEILETIAAKKDLEPCVSYIGPNGAGHFVKMVHNGIEYADMQLIAEVYLIAKYILKMSNEELSEMFYDFSKTYVKSYLLEITAKILSVKDPLSENHLIDMIKDTVSQKGTGKWTAIEALDKGVNISIISQSVDARISSNMKEEREFFKRGAKEISESITVDDLLKSYFIGKVIAYAEGFYQMKNASLEYDWDLNLCEVSKIFRAGCIIRADFLDAIMEMFKDDSNLKNLILHESMRGVILLGKENLEKVMIDAIKAKLPTPALSSALTYLNQIKSPCVGANLLSAQRDFFGAHKVSRIDMEGEFHYEWENL